MLQVFQVLQVNLAHLWVDFRAFFVTFSGYIQMLKGFGKAKSSKGLDQAMQNSEMQLLISCGNFWMDGQNFSKML